VGDDPQAAVAEFAGQIPGQIGAGQIQQRRATLQVLRLDACQNQIAQSSGVTAGRHHVGEAGAARGFCGMLADRKQRQLEQPVAL
jgi:hypothetical protein